MVNGEVPAIGSASDVLDCYEGSTEFMCSFKEWSDEDAPGNEIVRLKSVRAYSDQSEGPSFDVRFPICIEFTYDVLQLGSRLNPAFWLHDGSGGIVFISGGMHDLEWVARPREAREYRSRVTIPGNLLAEGSFTVRAIIHTLSRDSTERPAVHADESDAITFNVFDLIEGNSARGPHIGPYYGAVRPIMKWETDA